ncbi:MAG: Tol-Pal system beta propeller repeat protein TolB [Deltaproteobacteria bacterium]|nr:Tol-Pal system beta propeller repeat protein TolB [Deltaproteobacteria bacterium]
MKKLKRLTPILIYILFHISPAYTKVYLDIHSPSATQLPIVIPPFKNIGGTTATHPYAKEMAAIISEDLSFSGFFRLLAPEVIDDDYLRGLTRDTIRWDIISIIGAETIVTGGFQLKNKNSIITELRLFDAVQGKFITGKRYEAPPSDRRLMMHRFSNEIFQKLTGEYGVFTTKIAYTQSNGANKDIYVMDYDGGNRKRITWYESLSLLPAWSPDGKTLAFTSYKDGNPDLYVKNIYSGKVKKISKKRGINITPAWSPDGKKIALTLSLNNGNSEIYLHTVKTGKVERITHNWAIDVSPAWSPDGSRIAFISDRAGRPHLYTLELQKGRMRRLTFSGSENSAPSWSPRGDMIVYAGLTDGRHNIHLVSSDGGFQQQLTFNQGNNEDPAWSPDGRYIAYSSDRTGRKEIFIMRADGTGQKKITDGPGEKSGPAWSPRQ